jgi:hypothetical protein
MKTQKTLHSVILRSGERLDVRLYDRLDDGYRYGIYSRRDEGVISIDRLCGHDPWLARDLDGLTEFESMHECAFFGDEITAIATLNAFARGTVADHVKKRRAAHWVARVRPSALVPCGCGGTCMLCDDNGMVRQ